MIALMAQLSGVLRKPGLKSHVETPRPVGSDARILTFATDSVDTPNALKKPKCSQRESAPRAAADGSPCEIGPQGRFGRFRV